jgi:hypothetical protein
LIQVKQTQGKSTVSVDVAQGIRSWAMRGLLETGEQAMTSQTSSHMAPKPHGVLHSLADAWARYRKRRAAIAELQALGHCELERMVQDAGVTFSDLLALAKQNGDSAALLYRRLEQAGIDSRKLDQAVLRDMQRCCTLCESKAECAHEIEDHPKAASWPDYCPNRQTIEALASAKCH